MPNFPRLQLATICAQFSSFSPPKIETLRSSHSTFRWFVTSSVKFRLTIRLSFSYPAGFSDYAAWRVHNHNELLAGRSSLPVRIHLCRYPVKHGLSFVSPLTYPLKSELPSRADSFCSGAPACSFGIRPVSLHFVGSVAHDSHKCRRRFFWQRGVHIELARFASSDALHAHHLQSTSDRLHCECFGLNRLSFSLLGRDSHCRVLRSLSW